MPRWLDRHLAQGARLLPCCVIVAFLGAPALPAFLPSAFGRSGGAALRGGALGARDVPLAAAGEGWDAAPAPPSEGTLWGASVVMAGFAMGLWAASSRSMAARRTAPSRPEARGALAVRRADGDDRQLRPRDRVDGHGWVKEDLTFDDSDASLVQAVHSIELKKRPSGIKRYTHTEGKGAMVADMHEKARYPGDPQGQAAVAGVKKGYVVKSVAGKDVRGWDFEDIMDLLEDYIPDPDVASTAAFRKGSGRVRKNEKVDFPVVIEYIELKEGAAKAAAAPAMNVPEGAWMPRLSGWSDEDLTKERQRVLAMGEPDAAYAGPRYRVASDINDAWVGQLTELQKRGGLLPKKDAYLMVLDIINILKSEKTLNEVEVKPGQTLTVFGDLHGQYFDVLNIFSMSGLPSADRPFLFNGDFVDRGSWSIETILTLFALKLKSPTSVFFNRGNHEMLEANLIYGFAGETGTKYDMDLFNLFSESFRSLPLVHVINKEVMVVHAGLPGPRPRVWLPGQTHDPEDAIPPNVTACTLAEIAAVDRSTELTPASYKAGVDEAPKQEEKWETDTRLIIDCLWADPRGGSGYGPSYRKSRGIFMFGPDVSTQFCAQNNLKLVIRSHEVKSDGWLQDHPNLMSVFSAPNYLDTGGNKGAFLQLSPTGPGGSLNVTPTSYAAVPHPDIKPMHHQDYITENHPHLTRTMKKKAASTADDFGDSDFAGFQGPDEWEEEDQMMSA